MLRGASLHSGGPHEWGQWCARPMAGWSPFGQLAGSSKTCVSDIVAEFTIVLLTS